MQREKLTLSGPLLEADFYPVFSDGRAWPTRKPKSKPTTAEMMKYNRTVAMKKLVRLVNANFTPDDYYMHPTYIQAYAPQNEEEARRDIKNFLRRVKTRRASEAKKLRRERDKINGFGAALQIAGMNESFYGNVVTEQFSKLTAKIRKLEEPLKYIYVIEKQTYKTGKNKGRVNWHFHLFLTGGLDDRTLEGMWKHGVRTNCDNFQPETFGPEAAAKYMSKDPQGSRRFVCSKNLKKPREKIRDGRVTARGVERMATQRVDDREFWGSRYRGYRFLKCYARFNDYNKQWYVSAVMYRTDGDPPEWKQEEWLT